MPNRAKKGKKGKISMSDNGSLSEWFIVAIAAGAQTIQIEMQGASVEAVAKAVHEQVKRDGYIEFPARNRGQFAMIVRIPDDSVYAIQVMTQDEMKRRNFHLQQMQAVHAGRA